MIITALVAMVPVSASPLDLMYAFYQSNSPMSVTVNGHEKGSTQIISGRYRLQPPVRQSFAVETSRGIEEFRQVNTTVHVIDHAAKSYEEFRVPPRLVNPPQDSLTSYFYPDIFQVIRGDKDKKIKFELLGQKTVDLTRISTYRMIFDPAATGEQETSQSEQPSSPQETQSETPPEISIDDFGRIVHFEYVQQTSAGFVPHIVDFKNYSNGIADCFVRNEIEVGYVPSKIPELDFPIGVGNPCPKTPVFDLAGKSINLAEEFKGRRFILLVTAPDCEPCKKGEETWKKLGIATKEHGCEVIELSLGNIAPAKNPTRRVFYDKSGDMAKSIRTPVTPFLMLFDLEGRYIQGWAGYDPGQEKRMFDTFLDKIRDE